jgi:DNA-3-methyladenine glycosylase
MSNDPAARRNADDPRTVGFYARSVHEVARDLLGCTLHYRGVCGRIVETESYHEAEPACHAYVGLTDRTRVLFGPPGTAYVYRSYGVHALLNAVAEPEGTGAAVLIRAVEPLEGTEVMRARRSMQANSNLCSGPGKLTQAFGIWLDLNATSLTGDHIRLEPRLAEHRKPQIVSAKRVGITKATELLWRYCDRTSNCVSRPWPEAMSGKKRPQVKKVGA